MEFVYAKRNARFSRWIALRLFCTRLAPIFNIPEVELQCGFSVFGRCLSGDVRCGGNLEKVGDNIYPYAKCEAIFSHWIALRFVCARLSSIFDIPEVELEGRISVVWLVLSGDVHVRRNIEKVGKIVYAKGDARFPIGLHCAYVAHFGTNFRQTGNGIAMRFYDAQACPGWRCILPVKWCSEVT